MMETRPDVSMPLVVCHGSLSVLDNMKSLTMPKHYLALNEDKWNPITTCVALMS